MFSEHARRMLAETGTAQNALWSAIATAAGFIVSAASVLTALSDKKEKTLFIWIVVLGAAAIWAVLACFWSQKSHYLFLLTGAVRKEEIASVNHRRALLVAKIVPWCERLAMLSVTIDMLIFLWLCMRLTS
jgi:hypothetical protein